jgi:NAD(P)-dependent dehydrogenase (short-subunit alcohol dehydrogenase family)
VAIVTAAAGLGIGRAILIDLLKEGACVVGTDVSTKRLARLSGEIEERLKERLLLLECDVTNRKQVDNVVQQALTRFVHIDILVNNAGRTIQCPLHDMTDEAWDLIIDINLKGTFYCTRAVLPAMMKQQYGRIINISSSTVWEKEPNQVAYQTAKTGIIGFSRGLANEVAPYKITVNTVAPGVIWNPILGKTMGPEGDKILQKQLDATPLAKAHGRPGYPEDVAHGVLYLASSEAEWITGITLVISGGLVTG